MWLGQRPIPSIKLSSGINCDRTKEPTLDNWNTLRNTMECMWGTRNTLLINSIVKNGIVRMFIDGAREVCAEGKGYSHMHAIIGR